MEVAFLILINASASIKFRIVEMDNWLNPNKCPCWDLIRESMTLSCLRQTHEPLDYTTPLGFGHKQNIDSPIWTPFQYSKMIQDLLLLSLIVFNYYRDLSNNPLGCNCIMYYAMESVNTSTTGGECDEPIQANGVTFVSAYSYLSNYYSNVNPSVFPVL